MTNQRNVLGRACALAAFGIVLLAPAVPAQSNRYQAVKGEQVRQLILGGRYRITPLDTRARAALSKQGREWYEKGMKSMDFIQYEYALKEFSRATEADPNQSDLRFMVIKLAAYLGERNFDVESTQYYDQALEHAMAAEKIQNNTTRQRNRARYEIKRLTALRDRVEQRDEARRSFGLELAKDYARKHYNKKNDSKELKAFAEALEKLALSATPDSGAAEAAAAGLATKSGAGASGPAKAAPPSPFDGDSSASPGAGSGGDSPFDNGNSVGISGTPARAARSIQNSIDTKGRQN